ISSASEPPLYSTVVINNFKITIIKMYSLTPAAKNGKLPSSICLPRARICWIAPGGNIPDTTEILTPAFSKTLPSCITQVIPPPPSVRNHLSTLKRSSSSNDSKDLQKSACIF
ncbi:GSCOCG00003525001-RA-CDS, partial [Cotesia congregata]